MCPDDERWAELIDGQVRGEELARLEAHLDACDRCAELFAVAFGASVVATPRLTAPRVPDRIGRYRIRGMLGRGAMGIVLDAFDPVLGREVAMKLLQPSWSSLADASRTRSAPDAPAHGVGSSADGAKVLREARSLARLAHPGIVEIYEVGVGPVGPYIVMELVRGETLRAWMARPGHGVSEIVAMFGQAARALAAAHEAGIVHRDFKPDNAIVRTDGLLKVLDFGLARAHAVDEVSTPNHQEASHATGAIVGTPVYLAPECLAGSPADARSDQYAFFVSLFEAIAGHRPFEGKNLQGLVAAIRGTTRGRMLDALAAPMWLRTAIARGLAIDPDDRFVDMRDVVDMLERGGRRRRRRVVVAAAALAPFALGGAVWAGTGPTPCSGGRERMTAVWSPLERVQVQRAFDAVDVPWGVEIGERASAELDGYAQRWVAAHEEACRSGRSSDGAELDRRMACLARGLEALQVTSELLAHGELRTLERAPELTSALPEIEACADPNQAEPVDAAFDDQRAQLAKAKALSVSGDFAEAHRIATAVVEAARDRGATRLEVEAMLVRASALIDLGALDAASQAYEAAFFMAERLDANALALEAAGGNALVVGWFQRQPERALEWLQHAHAAARRFEPSPRQWYAHENRTGLVLDAASRHAEALEHHRSALGWLEQGENLPDLARTRMNIGMTLIELGREAEGIAELRAALDLSVRAFGASHVETQNARVNLAAHLSGVGEYEEALRLFEAVSAVIESSHADWPALELVLRNNWGVAASRAGRSEEGVARLREAVDLGSRMHGATHPETFDARLNLGVALEGEDDHEGALKVYRALRADMDAAAERSPFLAHVISFNEAVVLRELGRYDEALATLHDALAWAQRIDRACSEVADTWTEIARVLVAMSASDRSALMPRTPSKR